MKPARVKYPGGKEGKVLYRKKVTFVGKEVDGYSNVTDRIIILRAGASSRRQSEVLFHELLHQALDPLFLERPLKPGDLEEVAIDTISRNMVEIWTRNPAVFSWIHAELTSNDT